MSRDEVRVTTVVGVAPAEAFRVFTDEVGLWWRRGTALRFGAGEGGTLAFEGAAGGRLVESFPDGRRFVVGSVRAWEPGRLLRFGWRDATFAPGEDTEVEVRFDAEGAGTRLTLVHRGWDGLAPGHRARRGLAGASFTGLVGLRWATLAEAMRAHVARRGARDRT